MEPGVSLVRRWAVDWLAARNPAVCEEILAPEYSLLIGGFLLDGREAYVAGTLEQLDRFPGLGLTVHEVMASADRVAKTTNGPAPVSSSPQEAPETGDSTPCDSCAVPL